MSTARLGAASLILAVVVSVGIIAPSVLGLRVFNAADLLERYAPWAETEPDGVTVTNGLVSDTVDGPARFALRDRVAEGDLLPLWEGRALGGIQLGSVPNPSFMSPLNLPYRVLPPWYAPGLVKLLELAAAIGFSFLYLRRLRLGVTAAVLGGLVYAFSGFQVAWTNWPHAHIGALIPGLFWGIEYAIEERTPLSVLPVTGVVAVMWLEGFPSVTGYALFFGAIYTLVRLIDLEAMRRALRRGSVVLGGVALGTALAAFQLIPFVFWAQSLDLSAREQNPGWTLARRTLATLAVPDAFGNPVDGNYYGPADYAVYGPVNWVENQAFIGIAALGLIAVAAVYGRRVLSARRFGFLWGGTALCLVLIYVGGPLLDLFQRFPLFGLNHIGRLRSVMLFLLAVLAAVGAEAVVRGLPQRSTRRQKGLLVAALGVIAVVVGFGLVRAGEMANEAGAVDYFTRQLAVAAAVTAVVAAVLVTVHTDWSTAAFAVVPVIVTFEVVTLAGPWWPQIPREQFYPVTDTHEFLIEHLDGDRVAVTDQTLLPSTTTLYGIRNVTGHAFHTPEWADLLLAADPGAFRLSTTYSSLVHDPVVASSPILNRLGARYVVTDPRRPLFGLEESLGPVSETTELRNGDRATSTSVDGIRGIQLTLAEPFEPGDVPGVLTVRVLSADGSVVGTTRRRLTTAHPAGPIQVGIAESGTNDVASIEIDYSGDTPLRLASRDGGSIVTGVVYPGLDALRLVHAGGAVVYEAPSALPRVRWASEVIVIEDDAERVRALQGPLPNRAVVLSSPGAAAGGDATILVVEDDGGDRMEFEVTADGPGYLVIADSLTRGWRATLDGNETEIVPADHAASAVHVPAGDHVIVFAVAPEGWRLGWTVTLVAVAAVAAVIILTTIGFRRRSITGDSD